jgi:hypothetical protein
MCRIASRVEGGRSYCIGDSRLTMVEWDEGRERAVQPVEGEELSFCSDYCRLSDARDHSGQRLIKTANEQRREPIVVARPPPPPPPVRPDTLAHMLFAHELFRNPGSLPSVRRSMSLMRQLLAKEFIGDSTCSRRSRVDGLAASVVALG